MLLKEKNLNTDDCLREIKKCLMHTRLHNNVERLVHQVMELDYARARITLDQITDVLGIALEEI